MIFQNTTNLVCCGHHKIFFYMNQLYRFNISYKISYDFNQQKPRYNYNEYLFFKKQQRSLLNYKHVKCIIVISNNVYLAYKFLSDFIQQNTRYAFSQKFQKNCGNSYAYKLRLRYKYIACKIVYDSMQWSPRQNYHKNFEKNGLAALPSDLCVPKLHYSYFQ